MEIIKYSYEEIENLCVKVSEEIKSTDYKVDCIIGVAVSGLFPAMIMARLLNVKNVISVSAVSYQGKEQKEMKLLNAPDKESLKGKNILIVDDICDSGNTLIFLTKLLKDYQVKEIKSATVFLNKEHHKIVPDFYGEEINKWVAFPWDKFEKE
jgi:hypoxanthine phosphoribosyltransferase